MKPFRITGCSDLLEIFLVISTAQFTSQQMHTFFLTLSASENVTLCSQPLLFPGTKSGIEEIPGLLIFEAKQLDFQLPD